MDREFPSHRDSDPSAPVTDSQTESSTVPMTPPSINIGTVLKERYRIARELSRGGFGRVFLAYDQQLHNRPVVIKIKLDHAIEDPWFERISVRQRMVRSAWLTHLRSLDMPRRPTPVIGACVSPGGVTRRSL
jgi:serine/threonine protein kinase